MRNKDIYVEFNTVIQPLMNVLIHTGQTSIQVYKHDVLSNNLRHVHSKLNTKTRI